MVRYRYRAVISAIYFDGKSSRAHAVTLTIADGQLLLQGEVFRALPLAEVSFGERLGDAPRHIGLPEGAYCAVADHAGVESLLQAAGRRSRWVDRAQRSAGMALLATALVAGVLFAGWKWGLPAVAELSSRLIPESAVVALSDQALEQLGPHMLRPSQLPAQQQQRLRAGFERLGGKPGQLLFRDSDRVNAFALPDGRIVLLDPLVALADNDAQVLAVLAHERGHVAARHGLRLIIQSSVMAGVFSALVGDISTLLATAPAVLLHASYSRDFEREADQYAALQLRAAGASPQALADMLAKLQANSGGGDGNAFLSSHPAPRERMDALRRAGGAD